MALTKSDLNSIRTIVRTEVKTGIDPLKKDIKLLKKGIKRIEKKFDDLFNFLDREWSKLSRRVDLHDKYSDLDTKKMVNP